MYLNENSKKMNTIYQDLRAVTPTISSAVNLPKQFYTISSVATATGLHEEETAQESRTLVKDA